ncbi:hypothetical protein BDP81DRAFT_437878 [Colletotrichum phormii]|uniref:Secreted protein n=1 Tax=Colletotrichum phormii TaxID=359342 RepID=A0AAJ0ECC5_9PEZI|nr:uncharacterized protein BDP81DRAFT_437878 [Colletotrichum phormii]KAK1624573.1 hypothetical protein BDP81DRAFT_437878 [Colletotrichum phormii]
MDAAWLFLWLSYIWEAIPNLVYRASKSVRSTIIPAIRVPCPACRSHGLSPSSSSSSSSPFFPGSHRPNASCKNRLAIAMAICRHILTFSLLPSSRLLCRCIIRLARSVVHVRSSIQAHAALPSSPSSAVSPALSTSMLVTVAAPPPLLFYVTSSAHKKAL